MSKPKLWNSIGLAMRAGRVVSGDFAAEKAVKGGRSHLVLLDALASAKTIERYRGYASRAGVPVILIENMGRAIGRPAHMVAVVTDAGMAQMILKANANNDGGVV